MAPAGSDNEVIVVGAIGAPFGVRGWVHVRSFTQPPSNLLDYAPWLLKDRDGWRPCHPVAAKRHGQGLVAQFEGIDDRDAAAALARTEVAVARESLPELPTDEYYWEELVGLRVVDAAAAELGVVREIMDVGVHAVLVVQGATERLIPFVARHVLRVDLAAGQVTVDWQDPE